MQALFENMQTIEYSLYEGIADETDSSGNKTGEKVITYGTPVTYRAMLSACKGAAITDVFGVNLQYDRTMITANMSCPITETSKLWVGTSSTISGVVQPHNYIVVGVAKSLNCIQYALKEVKTS